MKSNLGTLDRVARIVFAVVVAALYFLNVISGTTAIVLGAVAGILLLTSLINFCPLYRLFNLSTRKPS